MDLRFFRSESDAPIEWPRQENFSYDEVSTFVFVPLERHKDPDALNHLGVDFYGAYGDGDLIDQWAMGQPLEPIDRHQLPAPLTWFPSPFSDPEA